MLTIKEDTKKQIMQNARIELARRDFFSYCRLKTPSFYKKDRTFLIELADTFQSFYESDEEDILIVNVPPRHGKSLTATHFAQWAFGQNPNEKIMTGSYNETLSTVFSKQVRNSIQEIKADMDKVVYSEIFPETKIQYGDSAMNLWSLEGHYNSYLATSPTGTATGFGASLMIIDDLIKNAEEANNSNVLEKHWTWFTDTMLSRLEKNGKIIVIMTRWHSEDLAGKILSDLEGYKLKHVNLKAKQDDGTMLCDDILSLEDYNNKTSAMSPEIASANYQQEPIDIQGRLYGDFKTYAKLPEFRERRNYTDTADTGKDYLCSINYGVTFNNEAYVLNVLYTKEPMEVTEPAQAKMMYEDKINVSDIESNSGGRGYARQVEKNLMEKHNSNYTVIRPFHQSKNKEARILTNATWVNEHVYMPENWRDQWPEFFKALTTYQREGKNKNDDAPDAITGIAEKIGAGSNFSFD